MIARQRAPRVFLGVIFISIVILTMLLGMHFSHGHDRDHPELDGWFDALRSGRGLCCSFSDGQLVMDADWESRDGHYRVRLEGVWYDVTRDAVINEPNRIGRTMVWPLKYEGQTQIRCFMPGPMT